MGGLSEPFSPLPGPLGCVHNASHCLRSDYDSYKAATWLECGKAQGSMTLHLLRSKAFGNDIHDFIDASPFLFSAEVQYKHGIDWGGEMPDE
jgi:hypothetical protein